jgi:NADH-quinone oxidoreductase subunit G
MATIYIDGQPYSVKDGRNLLQASLELGFNLPYFCWHPAMGSVGACRQCAVKQFRDENDQHGRLVMACMTPASEGARISLSDHEASEFRTSIIEWMMMSHPHDCPICDEGGECHLQDMTVMTGHNYRHYRGQKRTFENQNLGPLVNHEMNRCIQCYRCVRFYREYAGGKDLDAFSMRDLVYFGRQTDGVLESEFSGNLVEICPTGVFTDKTLKKHFTRKWDEQTAPSICTGCSLGCNIIAGERYGMLRRIRNRYNGEVNGYFLCDRGRYGYEFVNDEKRVRSVFLPGKKASATKAEALETLARILTPEARVIGIGSPRASLESNFALRSLVGAGHFYQGIPKQEAQLVGQILEILKTGPARSPSLHDVEQCDAVLVLGEDVTNTAPMLALALRQSVRQQPLKKANQLHIPLWDDHSVRELLQNEKGPLYIASVAATRLDDVATKTYHAAPADLARLGFAVAHALDASSPEPQGLTDDLQKLAASIATALQQAERPLVVSGASLGSPELVQAATNVAWALCKGGKPTGLCFTVPESNGLGLGLLGGEPLEGAFQAVQAGEADTVIVLENDLYRRAPKPEVDAMLKAARHLIVLDYLQNATTENGEFVLPAATFAEANGTMVNNEGRAQRFYAIFTPENDIQASWSWLKELAAASSIRKAFSWNTQDELLAELAQEMPIFEPVLKIAPPAGFRIEGMKIPRQPARYSGRTAMHANISVSEPKPPEDPESPLSFTMEGSELQPPSALIPRFWSPGWNSIQSLNKFQEEIGGPLRGGDPGQRLIEPDDEGMVDYFGSIPQAFSPASDTWQFVPLYHIFGSEELSIHSPGIAQLAPQPYLALNLKDAERINAEAAEFTLDGIDYRLPIKTNPSLPEGTAGVPVGLASLAGIRLPSQGKLTPVVQASEGRDR